MNSLKASVLAALIAACSEPNETQRLLGNGFMLGTGRPRCRPRCRPHSRRYKTGSHKQVLRKQGKLK